MDGWAAPISATLSTAHALQNAGFHVARLTLRDHGGTADLNEGLFHSAMTDEVVAAAEFIMDDFGCNTAGLVGFSMGGNFALRLCGCAAPTACAGHLSRNQSATYR